MAHKGAGRKATKAQRAGMPHYGPTGEMRQTMREGTMSDRAMQKMMRQMGRRSRRK